MHNTWLILIGAAGTLLACSAAYLLFHRRPDAAEEERLRRLALVASGRITGGELTDVRGRLIYYSYEVAGVGYDAAQDLSAFPDLSEANLLTLSGPVSIRYSRASPGNSIVHCETWSGLPRPASNNLSLTNPMAEDPDLSGALDDRRTQ